MENPLELPAPSDVLGRTQEFARDLAYGVTIGKWTTKFYANPSGEGVGEADWSAETEHIGGEIDPFFKYKKDKWNNKLPSPDLMLTFGYLQVYQTRDYSTDYILTPKAFTLLEKPATSPSAFISYKQTESSALALLIESRLKNIDPNISIFVDKNIESGESINSRIKESLEQSHYFICLLGSKTLTDSAAVKTEIDLAKKNTDCMIIPICHSGYTPDDTYNQYFGDNKAIIIKQPDSAEEYETNITKLLIRLGYSTI